MPSPKLSPLPSPLPSPAPRAGARVAIVLGLAAFGLGCGGASGRGVEHRGGAAARGDTPPCPTADALTALARGAWELADGTVQVECAALWAEGQAWWYLDGAVEREDPDEGWSVDMGRALVAAASGATAWREVDTGMPPATLDRSISGDFTAVDLDGDGSDELLTVSGYSHGGHEETALHVYRVAGGAVVAAGRLPLSADNAAAVEDEADMILCRGEHRLVAGPGGATRIEITATWIGAVEPDACPPEGRRVYRWTGEALVAE